MPLEPARKIIHLKKATRTLQEQEVPGAIIYIEESIVDNDIACDIRGEAHLRAARDFHKEQAQALVKALMGTLPQGTMHELIIELLHEYSCVYRGPCGSNNGGPILRIHTTED